MLFSVVSALAFVASAGAQLSLIYQFPNTSYVNIENVAIRSTTGSLLLSIATGPRLVQLDPSNPVPEDLITLPGPVDSLSGIAEISPDVFAVAAGNFSFGPQVPGGVTGIQGTFGVGLIDLTGPAAVATEITRIPEAITLNGLDNIPWTPYILIADSGLGAIWRVNTRTGEYKIAIQDAAFANIPQVVNLGINGLKIRHGTVYFTNSAQGTFGKVPINKHGEAVGPVQIIARAPAPNPNAPPPPDGPPPPSFDDFSLDKHGNAYIATQPDSVSFVSEDGSVVQIAGPPAQDPAIISPTSTALKGCALYVVTGGSANPAMFASGQVFVGAVC